MIRTRRHYKRAIAGLGLAGMLTAAMVVPAFADDVTGTADVTGGVFAMAAADPPAVAVTLDGTNQTVADPFDISVNDPTGTGAGWNLQITSTTFSTGGATPKTLSTSASSITGVNAVCDAGTCTAPTNDVTYPLTVPADATAPSAATFFSAAADSGMGDFTVTPTFSVDIPANTYAGDYSSTVTITSATGP